MTQSQRPQPTPTDIKTPKQTVVAEIKCQDKKSISMFSVVWGTSTLVLPIRPSVRLPFPSRLSRRPDVCAPPRDPGETTLHHACQTNEECLSVARPISRRHLRPFQINAPAAGRCRSRCPPHSFIHPRGVGRRHLPP